MEHYFGKNIKLLRQRKKRSQEDVSKTLDIKRTSLSGYENGSVEPPYKVLLKLSDYYKVSIDKLVKYDLSTISEMQLGELEKGWDIDIDGNKMRVLAITVDKDDNENIELIPEKAKAGYRTGFADPEYLKILPTFNLPFLNKNKKYRTFQINGDSMPPVSHEAYVTGEYVENWNLIKDGQPYIIITKNDGIVFKMIYNQIEEKKSLMLCSTNPIYEPYNVSIAEVLEVWKFVNFINHEMPENVLSKDDLSTTVMQLQKEVGELKSVLKQLRLEI